MLYITLSKDTPKQLCFTISLKKNHYQTFIILTPHSLLHKCHDKYKAKRKQTNKASSISETFTAHHLHNYQLVTHVSRSHIVAQSLNCHRMTVTCYL